MPVTFVRISSSSYDFLKKKKISLPAEKASAPPSTVEQPQARCWQEFPELPVTPVAGGELVREISRDAGGWEDGLFISSRLENVCSCQGQCGFMTLELLRHHCFLWTTYSSFIRRMVVWWETSASQKVHSALQHKHLEGSVPFIAPLWRTLWPNFPFPHPTSFLKTEKCLRNALALSPRLALLVMY